ncbi:MAG: ABC transporter ATP-binding protein [Desulfoferrobacter sp.]
MHLPGQLSRTSWGTDTLFEIKSLSYRYPDGRLALQGIDLTIYGGDRIALVGHNGAGKTTLIQHLNGLKQGQKGAVFYKGEPLERENLKRARLEVGMLFQDPDDQLFCNTIYEDVAFGPLNQGLGRDEMGARVLAALNEVELTGLTYKPPHHLSYGQKKRAALATLLSMNPDVLILDEPTANLDPKQEKIFIELLERFSGTLLCISHDLPFLYTLCTRAVVLEKGKIHHDYSMRELVSHPAYLRDHGLDFTFRFSCCQENGGHRHHHDHLETPDKSVDDACAGGKGGKDKVDFKPLIRLNDFSFLYPDGTWGVRDVNLEIPAGSNVAVVGENGAGKSTLVRCLMGIFEGAGDYIFNDKVVSRRFRKELWRYVGMVFQDPADQLFCPSCWEEVAFGPKQLKLSPKEVDARVEEALSLVRLNGYEDRVPHHLSAGERKRLSLAAVLSMRPQVLFLDEPSANLDPHGEELLLEILNRLDATKILITHDIFLVSNLCERTIVMHGGKVIRDYMTDEFERDEHLISINGLDYRFKNACCQEILDLQIQATKNGGS